jgi:hypothetical protein
MIYDVEFSNGKLLLNCHAADWHGHGSGFGSGGCPKGDKEVFTLMSSAPGLSDFERKEADKLTDSSLGTSSESSGGLGFAACIRVT